MFTAATFKDRRHELRSRIGSGIVFLPGNTLTPMNYRANTFPFRQDSTFRYFFGLNEPDLFGVLDADSGRDLLFADEVSLEDRIWMGSQETRTKAAVRVGVKDVKPVADLGGVLLEALKAGRKIHFLPQYRTENQMLFERLLGIKADMVNSHVSISLIKAVIDQRTIKSDEEIAEIERALEISYQMYDLALLILGNAEYEYEVAGAMEGVALQHNATMSFR